MKNLLLTLFSFLIFINPLFAKEDLEEVKEQKMLNQEQAKKENELQVLLEKAKRFQQRAQILSEKESQAIYEYFNQIDKDAIKRLDKLKSVDMEKYKNQLNQLYFDKMYLERIREEFPGRFEDALEIRKLDSESHKLSKEYKLEKDETEKDKIEEKLRDILSELFDLREIEKKVEMERIEEKLTYLADEIKKRRENKDIIVENRYKQLTGQNRTYEW